MMEDCLSGTVTSAHFQRDAEEATANVPSLPGKTGFYTMAGILDFLQLEWSKMQLERTQWDVEKAELQAKIEFLQGKYEGLENLRYNLIRRIKMLEYALIRERSCKNQEGLSKENEEAIINMHFSRSESISDHLKINTSSEWQNENGQLNKYLVDSSSFSVSPGFGNSTVCNLSESSSLFGEGPEQEEHPMNVSPKHDNSESKVLRNPLELANDRCNLDHNKLLNDDSLDFNFSKSSSFDYLSLMNESDLALTIEPQCITDPETAEALLEFEQLVAQGTYLDKNSLTDHVNTNLVNSIIKSNESTHKDWDNLNEQELLQRFKELYRADRFQGTSNNTQDTDVKITSLNKDDSSNKQSSRCSQPTNFDAPEDEFSNILPDFEVIINEESSRQNMSKNDLLNNNNNNTATKVLSKNITETKESTLRLEDLASLTTMANELDSNQARAVAVAMDNLDGMGECITNKSNEKVVGNNSTVNTSSTQKPTNWTAKYTLRSHFDAIRGIVFHPTEPILVTCSEDHTLKLWNLNKTIQTKKSSMFDVEPIYTFRGHNSPVLSVTMLVGSAIGENTCQSGLLSPACIYSSDLSGCIRSWHVSSLQMDPYDTFDLSVMGRSLEGHTDAVWSLCSRYDGLLLSTSADGTSRLWKLRPDSYYSSDVYFISNMLNKYDGLSPQNSVPTSATFLWTNQMYFATGFTSGHLCIFNLETNQIVRSFQSIDINDAVSSKTVCSVNSIISHPHLPLIISAHEDRQIRFWDSLSGKCVHSLTAHLDAVTTISVDAKGTSLLSASHDCSIRIWDINTKVCVQEITGHRKKFGEAINSVAFHPTHHYMASAGSDALAKVYI
ncbi:unnamed protein product [Trichobilharzia szidati]|nr:unnamed protein product [Trichobilharzia szidati]